MKVLHIGKYFPPYAGGMETYLRDLMAAQARQGIDVSALVHQSELGVTNLEETVQAGGQSLPITRAAVWARLLFTPISPGFPWLMSRLIKRQQPDILHIHMPNVSAFWALLLPGARRIPWVLQWQSDVLGSEHSLGLRLFYSLYRPFERAMLKHCKAVVASSPPYLASSQALKPFSSKCHVVPLGLDPANLPSLPLQQQTGRDSPLRVLAIGRLTYYKGFDYLIRAAASCDNIEVHLIGQGDQKAKLEALAKKLKLEDRIIFHGHLTDSQLAEQFRDCNCLCLPSIERTESFGMVLLEAMYHSKATVIADVPGSGMGWVVDNGVTGVHVPPKNVGELTRVLTDFEKNRDKIPPLGRQGRLKFDRLLHIDKSAEGISRLYTIEPAASSSNGKAPDGNK